MTGSGGTHFGEEVFDGDSKSGQSNRNAGAAAGRLQRTARLRHQRLRGRHGAGSGRRPEDPTQALYPAGTPIPNTNQSIRLPQMFEHAYTAGMQHPSDKGNIDARRLQPPFVELPNVRGTYEAILQSGEEGIPVYCYLAGAQLALPDQVAIEAKLVAQLKDAFPAGFQIQSVEVPKPDGGNTTWKRFIVTGDQQFLMENNHTPQSQVIPGTFDLWMHEGDSFVMIGWRWPDKALAKAPVRLAELPAAVAGTLAAAGGPPPAAK